MNGFWFRFFNSMIFWSAAIVIPLVMEIIPSVISAIHLFLKRSKKKPVPPPTIWPEISMIIPVYNSADSLLRCIGSIADSQYPLDKIRIYLVNNGSNDESFAIFQKAQEVYPKLEMQWLNAEQGKARALNLALYNSFGKYIINIDSDGILEKSALRNMVSAFEADSSIDCMTGTILTNPDEIESYRHFFPRLLRKLEFTEYAQAFLAGRSYASDKNALYTLSGAFSAFRKSSILQSQLYNTATIAEDTQITFQMERLFHKNVRLCENAIYITGPIESVGKLYTQRQRWQRGSLEVSHLFQSERKKGLANIFGDVNTRTMLYDHTFAFPRIIWYLALIGLYFLGYSGKSILLSILFIFLLYILISYLYFAEICVFLKDFKELRKYYIRQWWVVALLPGFNFYVFFIRFIGILNSENTHSVWKTRSFHDERILFQQELKKMFNGLNNRLVKLHAFLNQPEETDD